MTRFYLSNRSWYAEIQTTIENYRIDRCHCHATKNRPVEEAKRRRCCKRLVYKQFVQVSGPCGRYFLSYFPKRFTHLCGALYGDAILVYPVLVHPYIWPPEINKNVWSSHFVFHKKLCLFSRELAYLRINISSNTWNGCTAENQEERRFFNETAFLFWCHAL